jgi:hypothetical protein
MRMFRVSRITFMGIRAEGKKYCSYKINYYPLGKCSAFSLNMTRKIYRVIKCLTSTIIWTLFYDSKSCITSNVPGRKIPTGDIVTQAQLGSYIRLKTSRVMRQYWEESTSQNFNNIFLWTQWCIAVLLWGRPSVLWVFNKQAVWVSLLCVANGYLNAQMPQKHQDIPQHCIWLNLGRVGGRGKRKRERQRQRQRQNIPLSWRCFAHHYLYIFFVLLYTRTSKSNYFM